MGLMWFLGKLSQTISFPSRSLGESRNKEFEWFEHKPYKVLPKSQAGIPAPSPRLSIGVHWDV